MTVSRRYVPIVIGLVAAVALGAAWFGGGREAKIVSPGGDRADEQLEIGDALPGDKIASPWPTPTVDYYASQMWWLPSSLPDDVTYDVAATRWLAFTSDGEWELNAWSRFSSETGRTLTVEFAPISVANDNNTPLADEWILSSTHGGDDQPSISEYRRRIGDETVMTRFGGAWLADERVNVLNAIELRPATDLPRPPLQRTQSADGGPDRWEALVAETTSEFEPQLWAQTDGRYVQLKFRDRVTVSAATEIGPIEGGPIVVAGVAIEHDFNNPEGPYNPAEHRTFSIFGMVGRAVDRIEVGLGGGERLTVEPIADLTRNFDARFFIVDLTTVPDHVEHSISTLTVVARDANGDEIGRRTLEP